MLAQEPRRRVVVTGMAALCSRGYGVDTLWDAACSKIDAPIDTSIPPADAPSWVDERLRSVLDAQVVYGLGVAEQAWEQAAFATFDASRVGVVGGSLYGALQAVVEQQQAFTDRGEPAVSRHLTLNASKVAVAGIVAHRLQVRGHSKVVTGACATGLYVVGDALDVIRCGRADVVVAIGTQASLTDAMRASFRNLRAMSPTGRIRPFDRRRDGFVPTAGAAAMILESEQHAVQRGAAILAEVRGAGNSTDATMHHVSAGPAPRACVEEAVRDAGYLPESIMQISAHGSGTRKNDAFEASLFSSVFGDAIPPVTAPKRVLGHGFAAAGLQAAVLAVSSVNHGLIPPVGIDVERDPECDVPIVAGAPAAWEPGPVLLVGFGLGGHNGALVIAPWSENPSAFCRPQSVER